MDIIDLQEYYTSILQLYDVVENEKARKLIINSFSGLKIDEIDVTRFYAPREYEGDLGVYSGKKSSFVNELDAFLKLWLAELIEVEEWYDYHHLNDENAESMMNIWFLEGVCDYNNYKNFNLKLVDNSWAEKWANQVILYNYHLSMGDRRSGEKDAGVFKKNWQLIDEEKFSLSIEGIVKAVEIMYNPNWAGYRTLFVETKHEYVLISE